MNRSEIARLEMFRRVEKFGETYQSRFPEAVPSAAAFAELSTIVGALQGDAAASIANTREGRDATRAAREALVQRLDTVARMARVIARTRPGFDARFVRPRPKGYQLVRSTAHAYLTAVEPQAAAFVASGMPTDFVDTLRAALERFEAASGTRDVGKLARASAHAGIRSAMKEGRAAVSKIDVLVRYHFAREPEVMAAWTRAFKLEGLPSPKETTTPPTTVSPPSTSSSPSGSPSGSTALDESVSTVIKPAA